MKPKLKYWEKEDILHFLFKEDGSEYVYSVEVFPGVTAEVANEGEVIGLEILDASKFIADMVFDSVQAKILMEDAGIRKVKKTDEKEQVKVT